MAQATDRKIILLLRETRLAELIRRFNTRQQAQFYIEHLGGDFSDYLAEDTQYQQAVVACETVLRRFGLVHKVDRRYLASFLFGPDDLVVVLGQDGLVANTLKYLDGQPVIGVNPDPRRWDGALLPFRVTELATIIPDVMAGRRKFKAITMARATLNTGAVLYAVNDLFIGPQSHVSARYALTVGGQRERQSSSGIIVSTGLGSTGWLKSIHAGWAATAAALGGKARQEAANTAGDGSFPWDADHLHFYVREPFPSRTTAASLVIGRITGAEVMTITSEMPERGVIFSDGVEMDFLDFNSGVTATIGVAERQGVVVV